MLSGTYSDGVEGMQVGFVGGHLKGVSENLPVVDLQLIHPSLILID
jgi:hypothetical protein